MYTDNIQLLPSNELLQQRTHLKEYLDDLERLQNRYLQEHPEEDEDEVQLFGAGRLGFRHLDALRSHITLLPVKRKRSIWQQHLHNMAVQKGLSFANNDDLPVIRSAYEEIVRDPSLLQALIDQRDAYNSEVKDSVTMKKVILEKSLGQLKKYCDWLHSEFDVHLVYAFAIDSIRANISADFVCNSGVGQRFNQFFTASTGLTPGRYMRYLVSSCGPNIRAQLQGLPSASSVPVSASSAPVSVLPTETEHTYKKKRKVLVKAIREIVHRMLNEADCRTHRLVPWGDLLSGEAGRLQLRNWPRYDSDTSKKGKYQLQNLNVSQLQDIKDKLDMNIIFINAERSL